MRARLRRRERRPPRQQGDPLGQPRSALRHRLGRDRRTRRTWCAPATAGATSRCRTRPGNLLDQNVPDSISQNYSVETNPLVYTPDRVPRLSNPFPPIVPVKPHGDGRAQRGQPARVRPRLLERDAAHGHLAGELRAPDHEHADGRGRLRRQQGLEPDLGRQHQRGAAGARLAGLAPADPAALQRRATSSTSTPPTARATTACR